MNLGRLRNVICRQREELKRFEMKKPKIVIGITAYQSIVLIRGQLRYLSDKFDMYLMAPDHESVRAFCERENATHLPIKIERNPALWHDFVSLFAIIRIFMRVRPDVINLGTMKVSFLGIIAGWLMRVKRRVYTCRGFRFEEEAGFKRKYLILFEKMIAALSTDIICVSHSVAELGIQKNLFREDKIVLFGNGSSNGIDLKLFDSGNVDDHLLQELKSRYALQDKFVFGFVGRLVDGKGINELYRAFTRIYAKDNNVRLVVVGSFYRDQIEDESIIESYNSHPAIVMCGVQPLVLVPVYMRLFDLFVLPTWREGFGNVLLQAAAMGLAIVSTSATGCKDAVKDGYNGTLISPKSEQELYQAMTALQGNSRLREKYADNGRIWARSFDSEVIWSAMSDFYCKSFV
jgi:glycosyltransferase involved in cell wall biosynthesis